MSKSIKENKYDNKTAEYVFGNAATTKPASIASDPDKVDEKEKNIRKELSVKKKTPTLIVK
jgi:hypothetical protein